MVGLSVRSSERQVEERQVEQGAEEPEQGVEHSEVADPKEATVYPIATYPSTPSPAQNATGTL